MPLSVDKLSDTRNVLVIAYYFPPMGLSGVQRTLKFVKYLPEYGWNPIVLTSGGEGYYAYDESLIEELDNPELKIYRTPKKKTTKRQYTSYFIQKIGRAVLQTFMQPDSKIHWKGEALKLCEKIFKLHNIDVIFATAPPYTDFLVGLELSKFFNIPLICDYRDLWVDNPFNFYATRYHKNYSINLEREVLKSAEKTIVTNRDAKELIIKRYSSIISHDDIAIIPHGYDPLDFKYAKEDKPPQDKFVISHSGMFQDDRTPKHFINALDRLLAINDNKSKIEARFIGLMRKEHIRLIKKSPFQRNYMLTGYLPHKEAVRHLMQSHLLWLMLFDTARSPGKLYEYFGADKPVLISAPNGAMKQIVMESGAGFSTMPADEDAIFNQLNNLLQMWKFDSLPTPKKDFIEKFDRSKLTSELARELSYAMK